jgi:hypothetical protein
MYNSVKECLKVEEVERKSIQILGLTGFWFYGMLKADEG